MNIEYKLSGKSGYLFIVGLLLGPILMVLLSIIYAYIDVYNPFIYVTILVFIGLFLGILLIQKMVIRLSKCRNINSSIIYGILTGLFGLYSIWCAFIYVMFQRENIPIDLYDIILSPSLVYNTANNLSILGLYEIFGISIKGGLLWFIWIVEAIGIIGAGAIGGFAAIHEEVFCEDCNKWARELNDDIRLAIENRDEAKKIIDTDIEKILSFEIQENLNTEHIKVNLHQCSKCQNTNTVNVDFITYETNQKGEVKEKSEDFSSVFVISANQLNSFVNKKNKTSLQTNLNENTENI
jgi:hypothetical protein